MELEELEHTGVQYIGPSDLFMLKTAAVKQPPTQHTHTHTHATKNPPPNDNNSDSMQFGPQRLTPSLPFAAGLRVLSLFDPPETG